MQSAQKKDRIQASVQSFGHSFDACRTSENFAGIASELLWNYFNIDGEAAGPLVSLVLYRTMSLLDLKVEEQEMARSEGKKCAANSSYLSAIISRYADICWTDHLYPAPFSVISLKNPAVAELAPLEALLAKRLGLPVSSAVDAEANVVQKFDKKSSTHLYVVTNEPASLTSYVAGRLLPCGEMFVISALARSEFDNEFSHDFYELCKKLMTRIATVDFERKVGSKVLLVQTVQSVTDILQPLQQNHFLVFAESLTEALELVGKHSFDVIICGAALEESSMIELLKEIKKDKKSKSKPFICFQKNCVPVSDNKVSTVATSAAKLLGASYLNLASLTDQQLLDEVEQRLPEQVWST